MSSRVRALTDAVCLVDSRGIIREVSPSFESLTGSERKSIVGRVFSDLFVDGDASPSPDRGELAARIKKAVEDVLADGASRTLEYSIQQSGEVKHYDPFW